MMSWFWMNIPLALLFVCCWAGIPLWLTLTRWNAELKAKNTDLAARTAPERVFAQPVPFTVATDEASSPAYAGIAGPQGR